MKKIYTIVFLIILSAVNLSINAQIIDDGIGEYALPKEKPISGFGGGDNGSEEPSDLTFGSSSFVTPNWDRIQAARELELNAWFHKQYFNMKNEIGNRFGNSYSSFNEARNDYFKYWEKPHVLSDARNVKKKYDTRINSKQARKEEYVNNLKLLELRRLEISIGNIDNTSYGVFNFNGTPIGQIRSLSELNTLWQLEVAAFSGNETSLHNDRGTRQFLLQDLIDPMSDYNDNFNFEYAILNELLPLQINHYNHIGNGLPNDGTWYQLQLMQMYLNNVILPFSLDPNQNLRVNTRHFSTPSLVEVHANRHRRGGVSIFDDDYIRVVAEDLLSGYATGPDYERAEEWAYEQAEIQVEEDRKDYIDNLIDGVSNVDIRIQSVIDALSFSNSSVQAIWLNNHPESGEDMFYLLESLNAEQHIKDIIEALSNNSLTYDQKFDLLLSLENQYNPTPSNVTNTELDRIIRDYAKEFRRRGATEFADYLDSLLPIDPNTFTVGDRWDVINLIKQEKINYTLHLASKIINTVYESFKPVVEFALMEVGGTVALKLLSKLPVRYLTTPIKNVISRLKAPSSQAYEGLRHAKKFGIETFAKLEAEFVNLGLTRAGQNVQFHHLFEQRFLNQMISRLGSNTRNWKSIVVTPNEHQIFTNAWRQRIGYGTTNGTYGVNTTTATIDDILRAAREVYKDYPEILRVLGL